MNNLCLILLFSFTTHFPKSLSSLNEQFHACSNKLQCGSVVNIGYPFYDGYTRPDFCGYPGFQLYNCESSDPHITISDQGYYLKSIDFKNYKITISRNDTWTDRCPDSTANTTMDYSRFNFSSSDKNITFFFDCYGGSHELSSLTRTTTECNLDGKDLVRGYYLTQDMLEDHTDLFEICKSNLFLPVLQSDDDSLGNLADVISAFNAGFELAYMAENEACKGCMESGGVCGQSENNTFICHCADADYNLQCSRNAKEPERIRTKGMMRLGSLNSSPSTYLLCLCGTTDSGVRNSSPTAYLLERRTREVEFFTTVISSLPLWNDGLGSSEFFTTDISSLPRQSLQVRNS